MKTVAIAIATLFSAAIPPALAQVELSPYDTRYDDRREMREAWREERREARRERREFDRDFARVIESRPLHDAATARQECWNPRAGHYEEVREENKHRIGKGAAIGAVAGGVIGHQFDRGGGTAAGAVLGGLLGHHIEGRERGDTQPDLDMSRCRVADAGPASAYEVRYEYRGQQYVTRMDRDPGERLRVGEDVRNDGSPFDSVASYSRPAYVR